MDWWAIAFAAMMVITMWLARHGTTIPAATIGARAQRGRQIPLLMVMAVIAILAAIGVPNYQEYQNRTRLLNASLALDGARTRVDSLIRETDNSQAQAYLATAGTDIQRAAFLSRDKALVSHTAEFSASISSAREHLEFAVKADPALRESQQIEGVPDTLRRLERGVRHVPRSEEGTSSVTWIWPSSLLALGALFILSVLGVVFFVGWRHGNGKPDAAKRWIRVYLEPVITLFAIIGGLILVFYPDLDRSTSTWGAGVAGSGIGFWLKSVG